MGGWSFIFIVLAKRSGVQQRILKHFLVLSVRGLETRVLARQYHLSFAMPEMVGGTTKSGNEKWKRRNESHMAVVLPGQSRYPIGSTLS